MQDHAQISDAECILVMNYQGLSDLYSCQVGGQARWDPHGIHMPADAFHGLAALAINFNFITIFDFYFLYV